MRLNKQLVLLKSHIKGLNIHANRPSGTTTRLNGIHTAVAAAIELEKIPSLKPSCGKFLAHTGRVVTDPHIDFQTGTAQEIINSLNNLAKEAAILFEVLKPIVNDEADDSVYVRLPEQVPLHKTVDFLAKFENLNKRIVNQKFHHHMKLDFQGVEKGSEWIMLLIVFADPNVATSALKASTAFLNLITACISLYQKSKELKNQAAEAQELESKEEKENVDKATKALLHLAKKKALTELLQEFPLKDGQELETSEMSEIPNSMLELGKTIVEETNLEFSGYIEESKDGTIKTKVDRLKLNTRKETTLLPPKNSEGS